ncbi:MAG: cob(I)yrinic acid a,c-diamide adenosyltransferase [Acholeplasma sp.]|nr:cob(I)yrinic acid a,c-diamide adenosyltransferase [Acholeplasma sp.]
MKIYTKRGDLGETDLISERVSKSNSAIHLVGELDEASARLALCKHYIKNESLIEELSKVDHYLFLIASMIVDNKRVLGLTLDEDAIKQLEEAIDVMDIKLSPLKRFITYDGSLEAIHVSLLRTQIRKIERYLVDFECEKIILKYLNRLSDYLFTLMRFINFSNKQEETFRK